VCIIAAPESVPEIAERHPDAGDRLLRHLIPKESVKPEKKEPQSPTNHVFEAHSHWRKLQHALEGLETVICRALGFFFFRFDAFFWDYAT